MKGVDSSMLQAGVARAIINPPLTIRHGGWGAQSHITASHIEADFWTSVLILSSGPSLADLTVIVDLDLCLLSNQQSDTLRSAVAKQLNIAPSQVRVSATHTHAGPVVGDSFGSSSYGNAELYFDFIIEQTVGASLQAFKQQVPVTSQADYGHCDMAKNRRQLMPDQSIITGYNENGYTDPVVGTLRFDDAEGNLIASIVHYSCHPTTLGYTNQAASPDYPGVTKRFVEQTLGGICIFLQGSTGDIGPGPNGFLSRMDTIQDIGTSLGCAAVQSLISAKSKSYSYEFDKVVLSGASLGIWQERRKPIPEVVFKVFSEILSIPTQDMKSPEELQVLVDQLSSEINSMRASHAPEEEIQDRTYRLKRAGMALGRSQSFYGQKFASVEAHFIQIDNTVLIGLPLEPFAKTGIMIREKSPFAYTLFSGYSNGYDGYLPAGEDYPAGGYEVDNTAFSDQAADQLVEQILATLNKLHSATNQ